MTEKLYYQNAYQTDFTARVLSCQKGRQGYEVVLDRTVFYPEGGGQPADQGILRILDEAGKAAYDAQDALQRNGYIGEPVTVTDVQERGEEILHFCDKPLEAGTTVSGTIDWKRRYAHSQEHSGEHIFSGIVHSLTSFDNVGFHMGRDFITVDFNGALRAEVAAEAERLTNEAIYADRELVISYPEPEELKKLSYRSKKELSGKVRIVTVPGADVCACCGTHVKRTGEIGMVKVVDTENYKGGTRLTLKIGPQALADYGEKNESVKALSVLFSAKPRDVVEAAKRQQEQLADLKFKLTAMKRKVFDCLAREAEGKEKVCLFVEDLEAMEVRQLCDRLIRSVKLAAVFSGSDTEGYKYVLGRAAKLQIDEEADVPALNKRLLAAYSGRGGGRGNMVQGAVTAARTQLEAFFVKEGF